MKSKSLFVTICVVAALAPSIGAYIFLGPPPQSLKEYRLQTERSINRLSMEIRVIKTEIGRLKGSPIDDLSTSTFIMGPEGMGRIGESFEWRTP